MCKGKLISVSNDIFVPLAKKIYLTKFCRLNASKRCESWYHFLQFILFFYNLILIGVTIITFAFNLDSKWQVMGIIGSIIVFAVSLFISSKNYQIRGEQYLECYNALSELENKVSKAKPEDLDALEKDYNLIKTLSSNHTDFDNSKLRFEYFVEEKDPNYADNCWLNGDKDKAYWKKSYLKYKSEEILIKLLASCFTYLVFLIVEYLVYLVQKIRFCKR